MIPIHPVPGPDDHTVRWKVPTAELPSPGAVCSLPQPLAGRLGDGTVSRIVVGDDHVDVTLPPHRDWRVDGPSLRSALLVALETPESWTTRSPESEPGDPAQAAVLDQRLATAAQAALEGEIGDLARSHGGSIELVSVEDGVVTVRMSGACHGCPAAGLTLHARLERTLRQLHPDLQEVRSTTTQTAARRRWLRIGMPARSATGTNSQSAGPSAA